MTRLGVESASVADTLWRLVILTAAAALGGTAGAHAARFSLSDTDSGFSRLERGIPHRNQKARHHQATGIEASQRESGKPLGPLIIAISIQNQRLRIYDANGFFAETPISTGMPGHPTPMGVFSVIQKHKWHHSNIYSGAPMPYMQRITWSGVAMHAGVLPGYPASHGCIRMPMAFAIKMWNWTKMGARVVVTPGELTPVSFSHPLLAAQKVVPQPSAAADGKSEKAAAESATSGSTISAVSLELRTSVGQNDSVKTAMDQTSAPAALRDQTRTADASHDLQAIKPSVTMTDATPSVDTSRNESIAGTGGTPSVSEKLASPVVGDAANAVAKPDATTSEVTKSQAEPTFADTPAIASSEHKPVEGGSSEALTGKTEPPATAIASPEQAVGEKEPDVKTDHGKSVAAKPEAPQADRKLDATKSDTGASVLDLNKDRADLPDAEKPAVPKSDIAVATASKRGGQIAVFISRKDSRLYVRQNFAPLFDVPVTIAPSDRPLGTHVFTAQVDGDATHWSVVSLPVPRHAAQRNEDERQSHRRKTAAAVEIKEAPVPDSPTEALDRLTIPLDAMTRISEALTTGGSIIISDQGINAGETGEGTDFIVSLH